MKTFGILLLFVFVYLMTGINVFGDPVPMPTATPSDCTSGQRNDGAFYTDCYPQWSGEPDDTLRLQRAVDAATGKLVFNEGDYDISATIKLHSYLTIEGLAPARYVGPVPSPTPGTNPTFQARIILNNNNQSVFYIGSGMHQISIRDLGLYYGDPHSPPSTPTNANGIFAEESNQWVDGVPGSTIDMASSQGFQFNNLHFFNFTRGIYVHSRATNHNWQFDDSHLEDSAFDRCKFAIFFNGNNIGFQINSIVISSGVDQNGIWIRRAGYISMNMVVGNGTIQSGEPVAREFIHLDKFHGPTSIQNCNGEAYQAELWIKGRNFRGYPVELINNVLPACPTTLTDLNAEEDPHGSEEPGEPAVNFGSAVGFSDATVFSHGNYYACAVTDETADIARPEIKGLSEVVSTADKFCRDLAVECFDPEISEFALMTNGGILRSDHLPRFDETTVIDWSRPVMEIKSSYPGFGLDDSKPVYQPLLALSYSLWDGGTGITRFAYTFTRNSRTGRLEMEGSQTRDTTGYYFKKGPVQLQSSTAADLHYYDTVSGWAADGDSGSLLYCSNCVAPSTPCTSGGSGALALKVGSDWHCK